MSLWRTTLFWIVTGGLLMSLTESKPTEKGLLVGDRLEQRFMARGLLRWLPLRESCLSNVVLHGVF
jgi:hypothetical protein